MRFLILAMLLSSYILSDTIYLSIDHSMFYNEKSNIENITYKGTDGNNIFFELNSENTVVCYIEIELIDKILNSNNELIDYNLTTISINNAIPYNDYLKELNTVPRKPFFLFNNALFLKDEKFIERCKSNNCHTIFLKYGIEGNWWLDSNNSSTDKEISKNGTFLGYSYNMFNLFKRKKVGVDLGFLLNINQIEVYNEEQEFEIQRYYDKNSIFFKISYDIFPWVTFFVKNHIKMLSVPNNVDRYLSPAIDAGLSFKLFKKYYIAAEISRYGISSNEIVSFESLIIRSLNFGYEF